MCILSVLSVFDHSVGLTLKGLEQLVFGLLRSENTDLNLLISGQCSLFIPPENIQNYLLLSHIFRRYEKETLGPNGIIVSFLSKFLRFWDK